MFYEYAKTTFIWVKNKVLKFFTSIYRDAGKYLISLYT